MQKTGSYNIAVYPPVNIRRSAIEISRNYEGIFVLDDINYFPHISLYMTEFPLKNLEKIEDEIQKIVSSTKSFQIKQDDYRVKDGYFDIAYDRSDNIIELQKVIVNALNPLREGALREKDKIKMMTFSKVEKENIEVYGYRHIGAQFVPHLTFTRFAGPTNCVKAKSNLSMTVSEIGIFVLGDNGTCREKIEIFNLRD